MTSQKVRLFAICVERTGLIEDSFEGLKMKANQERVWLNITHVSCECLTANLVSGKIEMFFVYTLTPVVYTSETDAIVANRCIAARGVDFELELLKGQTWFIKLRNEDI